MAVSSGTFSTFLCIKTTSFHSPSTPPTSLRLASHPAAKLRLVRAVTSATASSEPTAKRVPRGIMKPRPVSPEMQDIVELPEIARTQALKRIWAYIKEHELQVLKVYNINLVAKTYRVTLLESSVLFSLAWLKDPQNKREILCDEKLKKIFEGRDRVGFLEIAKLIGPHFL